MTALIMEGKPDTSIFIGGIVMKKQLTKLAVKAGNAIVEAIVSAIALVIGKAIMGAFDNGLYKFRAKKNLKAMQDETLLTEDLDIVEETELEEAAEDIDTTEETTEVDG